MDERADQIIERTEPQRNEPGSNLNELENRVPAIADWRVQFDQDPLLMLGVVLGVGVLLGAVISGSRSLARSGSTRPRDFSSSSGVDLTTASE